MNTSTQYNAQFNVDNFQRIEVDLSSSASDQNGGFFVAQVEGDYLFVERCDYPVLISLTSQKNVIGQCEVAKEGDQFKTAFKGVTITYPRVGALGGTSPAKLVFIVGKNCADYTNTLATVQTRFGASSRAVSNTALLQTVSLHVPPGMRRVATLECSITAYTTLTASPLWAFFRRDGSGTCTNSSVSNSPQSPAAIYNGQNHSGLMALLSVGAANSGLWQINNLVIPDDAAELQVSFAGTGLVAPLIRSVWQ